MSMLADTTRRKQKISSNPNGLYFKMDEDGIGSKLMGQMGWEKGKGLGLNEQGNKDPIKVRSNMESRGLGCKRADLDKWIAHQDDFNSLLANLNQSAGADPAKEEDGEGQVASSSTSGVQSLEAKSKSSRSRVHYMKFTKGKDLSHHSNKDLACILGPSRSANATPLNSAPQSKSVSRANSDNEDDKGSDPFLSDTRTVTSTMSLQEYFAAKMAARKSSSSNLLELANKTPSPDQDIAGDAAEVSVAKAAFYIGEPSPDSQGDDAELTEKKQKKKKKSKSRDRESPEEEEEEAAPVADEHATDEQTEEAEQLAADKARRKKLRKKRRREEERLRLAEEEAEAARHKSGGKTKPKPADDTMKFVSEESSSGPEQEVEEPPKKKKKSKKNRHRASSEENHQSDCPGNSEISKSSIKKSKSDSLIEAHEDTQNTETSKPKKQKKSKNKFKSGD